MLLEDDEQFEHEEAWMEECQEIYLKLSTDTEDFLKEQLVLRDGPFYFWGGGGLGNYQKKIPA